MIEGMEKDKNHPSFIGKAGEYAVAAQLLARGIIVHFPAVDTGVDLIAGERIRIQVKARHREKVGPHHSSRVRVSGYNFTLGTKRMTKTKAVAELKAKSMADWFPNVDFLICWGIDDNRFWIIPSAVMAKHPTVKSLLLGGNHKRFVDRDRIHKLLASGMRQCDVAKEMDIHPVMVSEFARGKKLPFRKIFHHLNEEADKYENAWHEIIQAVGLTNQIDTIDQEFEREFGGAVPEEVIKGD